MIFFGILLAIFSSVIGQFFRFPIAGGGVLFLDIFLPLLSFFWVLKLLKKNESPVYTIKKFPIFWPAFVFVLIALVSVVFAASELSFRGFLESGFYLFRYFFLLLFPVIVAYELTGNEKKQKIFLYSIFSIAGILAVLGFLQLKIFPDFTQMQRFGWDPHIGRLLSTWFDPNFLGGFFAFILVILGGVFIGWVKNMNFQRNWGDIIQSPKVFFAFFLFFLVFSALVFTFSRSALLAFIISAFFLGFFYMRGIFLVACFALFLVLPFVPRATERISDGLESVISVMEEDPIFLPDQTARLRVENFAKGSSVIEENFWTGIGFNTLRIHNSGENINSSGGFDSSFITVFALTGIFGFFAFLWLWWEIGRATFRSFLSQKKWLVKYVSLAFFWSIFGVLAQSFFINNLFYSFFIVLFFGVFGWMVSYADLPYKKKN